MKKYIQRLPMALFRFGLCIIGSILCIFFAFYSFIEEIKEGNSP